MITTDKGAVKQCIRNVVTVLQNDPKFKGVIRYNMMTDRNDIVKDLGWYRESPVLTDSDIDHIMLYLEENYSLTTEKKIKSAINVVAMENKYHPIQEKLNSLVWDFEKCRQVKASNYAAYEARLRRNDNKLTTILPIITKNDKGL